MNRKKPIAAIAVPLVAFVILAFAGATPAAAQPPILPDSFYGGLSINGGPAPAGVTLVAKISGVERGRYVTEQSGRYGYSGAGQPKLLVEGTSDDIGKVIHFYIENYDGSLTLASNDPTPTFESGADPREINLVFEGVQPEAPAPSPGNGGGGAAPTYYTSTSVFGTSGRFRTNSAGKLLEAFEATSADGKLTVSIPKDTVAKDKNGNRLTSLTSDVNASPANPPEGSHIIGLAYNFGPDGATFNPAITFTWSYDPDALPEGVDEEDLVIAYYDETAGEWVELDSTIDTENNVITASVAHFTTFAIIGAVTPAPPPAPAAFSLSNLSIQPIEVQLRETVSISVSVANTGGLEGSYTVVLKINGVKEAEKSVTVAAGKSQGVSFTVAREDAGSYSVVVDGLSGTFTVAAPPLAPAAFSVSNLSIQPQEVKPKETVTITVAVANTGGTEGSYTVVLKVNGVEEAEKTVTVAAGGSETVSFPVSKEEAGTYSVAVNGLSGSFTVVAPEVRPTPTPPKPEINWPLIGGIIAAVVVAGLVIFFLVRRRRAY